MPQPRRIGSRRRAGDVPAAVHRAEPGP